MTNLERTTLATPGALACSFAKSFNTRFGITYYGGGILNDRVVAVGVNMKGHVCKLITYALTWTDLFNELQEFGYELRPHLKPKKRTRKKKAL